LGVIVEILAGLVFALAVGRETSATFGLIVAGLILAGGGLVISGLAIVAEERRDERLP
jgi:hypothetical protein